MTASPPAAPGMPGKEIIAREIASVMDRDNHAVAVTTALRILSLIRPAFEAKDAEIAAMHDAYQQAVEALEEIAECTDPDGGENYRADDREGCLDTVHALSTRARTAAAASAIRGEKT